MRNLLTLASLASLAAATPQLLNGRGTCSADNCLRAVRGINRPGGLAGGLAECKAYFTPSGNADRDISAREGPLPTYVATPCAGSVARYSSACSCASTTATGTSIPHAACKTFKLQVSGGDELYDGKYLVKKDRNIEASATSLADATTWSILPNGQVIADGDPSQVWATYLVFSVIELRDPSKLAPKSDTPYYDYENPYSDFCSAPEVKGQLSGPLTCDVYIGDGYGRATYLTCPETTRSYIGVDITQDEGFDSTCRPVSLLAIPACS